jgi:hypothetical protein
VAKVNSVKLPRITLEQFKEVMTVYSIVNSLASMLRSNEFIRRGKGD